MLPLQHARSHFLHKLAYECTRDDCMLACSALPCPGQIFESSVQMFPAPGEQPWPPKRPMVAIALDNVLDAVSDVARHVKRMDYQASKQAVSQCDLLSSIPSSIPSHACNLPQASGIASCSCENNCVPVTLPFTRAHAGMHNMNFICADFEPHLQFLPSPASHNAGQSERRGAA